jgi:DNA modification methylase
MQPALPNREIRVGDCRALLRELPDESVNCVVTSPPYWGLRDYGVDGQLGLEETPEAFVAEMVDVFREARRVLRADGTLWLNIGDSYSNIGKRGGSTSGKHGPSVSTGGLLDKRGHRGERLANGRGDQEAILRRKTVGTPPPTQARRLGGEGLKPKDLVGIPWMVAFALRADGWYLRSDIIWAKPNPMPESVADRPTKAHEYIFLLTKSEAYYYDAKAIAEPGSMRAPGGKGATKYQKANDAAGDDRMRTTAGLARLRDTVFEARNKRTVWTVGSEPYPGSHFATFPTKLVEPCILAGCPAGGLVLDPFGGSGTVGEVAEAIGRRWMLIELNPAYAALARARTAQRGLFGDAAAAALAEGGAA